EPGRPPAGSEPCSPVPPPPPPPPPHSLYLYRLGKAPQIQDLYGKVKFTEEEIDLMELELGRQGVQMPAFNNIGGILTNELSEDEAAERAAVASINAAVRRGDLVAMATALRNPAARLEGLEEALMGRYQEQLQEARGASGELTLRQIQEQISAVNVRAALRLVDASLEALDPSGLLGALQRPCLGLRGLQASGGRCYLEQLLSDRQQKAQDLGYLEPLDLLELQESVSVANREAQRARRVLAAVRSVNAALRGDEPRLTISCLMTSDLQLPELLPAAAGLYHRELRLLQGRSPQAELQQEELFVAVEMLTAVALVNAALEAGLRQPFGSSLVSAAAGLSDVDPALLDRYFDLLASRRQQVGSELLTWNQLQEGIDSVNQEAQDQHQQLLAIGRINRAVLRADPQKLLSALMLPSSGLEDVSPPNTCRYLTLLTRARELKAQVSRDPGAELWLAEIQEVVKQANQDSRRALKMSLALAAVHQAVKEDQPPQTLRVLLLPELELSGVLPDAAAEYQRELSALLSLRTRPAGGSSSWVRVRLRDGDSYHFDLKRLEGSWETPADAQNSSGFLSQPEIQEAVLAVGASRRRGALWRCRLPLLVRLQALSRGFLLRRRVDARRHYLRRQGPAATIIQAHWRRFLQQREYRRRLELLYGNWRAVVKIQAFVRMWRARRIYRARLRFFRQNVRAVVKIQAFFRASRARHEYRMLVHSEAPPLAVLRRFLHLLEVGGGDLREEARLLALRGEVLRSIRSNRQLENDLQTMDLKIGLLVRNRATLQEVVSHCKKLTKKNSDQLSALMDGEKKQGLKALSRESRRRLEAYQHLFYLLQVTLPTRASIRDLPSPPPLARLLTLLPQSVCSSLETLVFSLFGFGSDARDAFLLLQLFREGLQAQIRLTVDRPQDVVTGNPAVIQMLVNFYRHARGQNVLREVLGPACSTLQDLLQDQGLSIRTDPVEVYSSWINQTETQTGLKSSLPYQVSPEEALLHPEVQRRLDVSVINLQSLTARVLKAISSSLDLLPYGFRYIAKVLRDSLKAKFPSAREEELYKIVGNLVYYRYMNPAVVAPDGFGVLERPVAAGAMATGAGRHGDGVGGVAPVAPGGGVGGGALQPEHRRVLGSVARMLQHAAANKHLHGDGRHVRDLNQFISQTHARFRRFLEQVCDVPEPEDHFNMDEFSEELMVHKPVIYISVSELLNTHKLLLEHQDSVCPDRSDPLRQILEDLGPVPPLQELLGDSDPGPEAGKTEVSLTLTNRFDIFSDSEEEPHAKGLLLSTKQLIIDIIRTQPGDSLRDILRSKASPEQEASHDWLVRRRAQVDAFTPEKLRRNESLVANGNLSLAEKKRKALRSLRRLEALGLLPGGEEELLKLVAKDVRQRRLRPAAAGGGAKAAAAGAGRPAAEEQLPPAAGGVLPPLHHLLPRAAGQYRHYTTCCLGQLARSANRSADSKKRRPALSYSAARLQEKGVLLAIEDLPASQFRNVVFDIVPAAETGSFTVKTRFLGVEMEEFLLRYQDLLQLQYEGVSVMKMFDKAKVNVNLLIFLLNKKFFKK
ncbi:LOW QUALITY PROTEIN: ras GTPase-activating-like protein IQGAP3, partial [Menidia menidia]